MITEARDRVTACPGARKRPGSLRVDGRTASPAVSAYAARPSAVPDVRALPVRDILFPTDFSEPAVAAWPYAVGLAKDTGATLHLLHVVAPPAIVGDPCGPPFASVALVNELAAHAQTSLDELVGAGRDVGVAGRSHLATGAASAEIIAHADAHAIGLIVMATTGRTGLAHIALGSVAERVVRHAPCRVLTVRYNASAAARPTLCELPRLRSILVPLDGSTLAEGVLPDVVALAKRYGADVTLLHVVPGGGRLPTVRMAAQGFPGCEAETYLADVEHRLAAAGVRTRIAIRHGEAAEAIRADIDKRRPDLVALSTHGRTGLTHLLLGSVAARVLRTSRAPVLVLPARAPVRAPILTGAEVEGPTAA